MSLLSSLSSIAAFLSALRAESAAARLTSIVSSVGMDTDSLTVRLPRGLPGGLRRRATGWRGILKPGTDSTIFSLEAFILEVYGIDEDSVLLVVADTGGLPVGRWAGGGFTEG